MDEVEEIDELGPVDWIVVEFPGSRFNGQIAPALLDLVERDLVRVLDLLVLKKDDDGSLEATVAVVAHGVNRRTDRREDRRDDRRDRR